MNKQILISWFCPENGIECQEEFFKGIQRILDEVPDEFICLVESGACKDVRALFSASRCLSDINPKFTFIEVSTAHDSAHQELWSELSNRLLPCLETKRGNTFHVDSSSAGLIVHAVWVMFYYAGLLPNPTKVWTRSSSSSGAVRFSLLKLPVESLDLRLRKSEGGSRKAIYQRDRIQSSILQNCLDLLITASRIPSLPLLLLGEKGTGKTRLVESVLGAVRNRSVQTVLCGALQPELALSQLFGHVKGAFTGADKDAPGLIGEAAGGILFFDEIQDLPRIVQRMLVRFLQDPDHLYRRVGSSGRELKAEVELVFASHKTPEELSTLLDSDLYDRISLVTVEIPPLREFRDDLPEIWRQVWLEHGKLSDIVIDPEHEAFIKWFRSYGFPGNLRDLISLALWIQIFYLRYQSIEAAISAAIKHIGGVAEASDFHQDIETTYLDKNKPFKSRMNLFKRSLVQEAVSAYGSYSAAARALGVDEKTVRNTLVSEINSE
jgi:DNA-binding NtrC family response regulator